MSHEYEQESIVAHAEAIVENADRLFRVRNLSGLAGVLAMPTCFGLVALESGNTFAEQFGAIMTVTSSLTALGLFTASAVEYYNYRKEGKQL